MTRLKKPKAAKPDTDNPEWTKADFSRARRLKDDPAMKAAIKRALRGRPADSGKKEAVTISLDKELVTKLRASGAGWQTRLNDMVRSAIGLLS